MLTTNLPWKTKLIQIHQFDLLNLLNFNLAMLYFLKFLVMIEDECQLWKIQLLPLLGLELETSLYATEWRSNCKTSDIWPPRTWIFEKCISWSLKSLMNPFTPTGGQSKNWKKNHSFLFFFFKSCKTNSTMQYYCEFKEISFEWLHHGILSTDSKVRTTLHVSIIDSGSERV